VKNIQESLGELTKFLNFESTAVPTLVGSQKVNVCFLKTNNVFIELIEPAETFLPDFGFRKEDDYWIYDLNNAVKSSNHLMLEVE
jgi:hypothetical protein